MSVPRRARPLAAVLAALLAVAACGSDPAPPPAAADDAELVALIDAEMRARGIPGLAAARIEHGRVTWARAFGWADVDARRPVTLDTPFTLASVSKTVVAAVLMRQKERGTLSTTVAIDGALGLSVRHPSAPGTPITAAMLASHTSGVVDDFVALGQATTTGDSPQTLRAFTADYTARADHFGPRPGTRRSYANAGFAVLGAFLEGATGESLPALSRRDVFEPLGMTRTAWTLDDTDVEALAVPYGGTWADGFTPGAHEGSGFYPATFLRSTVEDLSRFVIAVMSGGGAMLSAASNAEMLTPAFPSLDADQAVAWYFEEHGGRRYLGHTGSAYGVSTAIFFLPEAQVGVIVLTNSDLFLRSRLLADGSSAGFYAIVDAIVDGAEGVAR